MHGMTYDEFSRQIGKAGLNIREFADLVKMNRNSVTNLARRGEVPSHLAVIAALLGEMAEHKIDFRHLLAKIEIVPKKPRGSGENSFGRARAKLGTPDKVINNNGTQTFLWKAEKAVPITP